MKESYPKVIFAHIDRNYKSIFVEYLNQGGYQITIDNNLINEPFEKEKIEVRNYKNKKKVISYFKTKKINTNNTIINSAIQSIINFRRK